MSSDLSPTIIKDNQRNELLCQPYAAIDTEYRKKEGNRYSIFAVAIVDSLGNIKVKHESDFCGYPLPEKELVKWAISETLKYKLTIGWYSKGARLRKEDGSYAGKDSDLKIIDDACKFYDIPSIIAFDKRGIPYVRGYGYNLYNITSSYVSKNRFEKYYHIDLYDIYKKPMVKNVYQNRYKSLDLDSVSKTVLGEGKLEDLDGQQI